MGSKTLERKKQENLAAAKHVTLSGVRWEIEGKITTVGIDCPQNSTAAAKPLPFEHMPCCITVSVGDSGFVQVSENCWSIQTYSNQRPRAGNTTNNPGGAEGAIDPAEPQTCDADATRKK